MRGIQRFWLGLAMGAAMSAGAGAACGSYGLAFYELGLLYYRDAQGQARGIDLDLVEALKARSGCRFQTVLESRVRIWAQLAGGQLDLSVSGIPTPEREQFAEFLPYFHTRNYLLMRRGLPPQAREPAGFLAIPELRVGVVKSFKHGPLYDSWLAKLREQSGRVVEAADFDTVVRLFSAGRIDAFLALPTSWLLAARQQGLEAAVDMLDWAPQDRVIHGLIISRQRVPEEDKRRLREAMASLRADGTVAAILRRHVGAELAQSLLLADQQGSRAP